MTPFFADGEVTLYLGDAREVLPTLPEESVDLLLTDPPYGMAYEGGWREKSHGPILGDLDKTVGQEGIALFEDGRFEPAPELHWEENSPKRSGVESVTYYPVGFGKSPYWTWGIEWELWAEVYRGEGEQAGAFVASITSGAEGVADVICPTFPALLGLMAKMEPAMRISQATADWKTSEEHLRHLQQGVVNEECARCLESRREH